MAYVCRCAFKQLFIHSFIHLREPPESTPKALPNSKTFRIGANQPLFVEQEPNPLTRSVPFRPS